MSDVEITRDGRVGRIRLNRPKALNALDLGMIRVIADTLVEWMDTPSVHAVVIEGEGERAFCAGGDIRAIRTMALAGDKAGVETFFAEEYTLNAAIAAYPKPYVALIDGICMGGGIGLSIHGDMRVTSEAGMFAMPETAIGMFPDVGATYALPRLPGELGMYLGLTGTRLSGADAVHAGIATHFVRRAEMPTLKQALAKDGVAVVAAFAQPLAPFTLAPNREAIDRCFGADDVPGILSRLAAEGSAWGDETLATLRAHSPSALLFSFAAIRAGACRSLPECLAAELALTRHVTIHPDLAEGVRAMVVDKDRTPRWTPDRVEDVDPASIARMMAA